ncbi:MAG TPA: hypothetical protein VEL76_04400 [Gemmataceae bacterium]|nr:hypothetical protein [Gemmataceae bacterium]
MTTESNFLEIAKGLLQKTRQQKAPWTDAGGHFLLLLKNARITLSYQSPVAEPDFITVTFSNKEGKVAATWTVHEEDPGWELVNELHEEVRRRAAGWEKVLADIEDFIRS